MLGKMIKYEFKQIRFTFLLMIVFIMAVTGLAFLFGVIPILNSSQHISDLGSIMVALSIVIYLLVFFAVSVGSSIYVGLRFYKTMYSNGGYLTHTLPVSTHELLIGKIIPTGLCMLLLGFFITISAVMVMGGYVLGINSHELGDIFELMHELMPAIQEGFSEILNIELSVFIVIMLINVLLGILSGPLFMMLCVSIGQLFNTHRVLMSVIAYIGLSIVMSTFSSIIGTGFNTTTNFVLSARNFSILPSLLLSTAQSILMIVFSYMGCYFIVKNKLNLE